MNLSYILLHGAPLVLGLLIGLFLESKSKFMFSATIDPHIMDILMRDMEKIHQESFVMTDIPEELITVKASEIRDSIANVVDLTAERGEMNISTDISSDSDVRVELNGIDGIEGVQLMTQEPALISLGIKRGVCAIFIINALCSLWKIVRSFLNSQTKQSQLKPSSPKSLKPDDQDESAQAESVLTETNENEDIQAKYEERKARNKLRSEENRKEQELQNQKDSECLKRKKQESQRRIAELEEKT
ncbi:hypothetical protein CRE_15647 [Caenorhabditis remanei]|uniref:Uncharacterized protein n=1 Tax=Caenorhabditis remanei TaxID=31234 RepID=E3N846_CAERE|nr:hypothetical protein CRE_15647 [Caenorhabditis remanei]